MKKIIMFFTPLVYMIIGLMIMFFIESTLLDQIMNLFNLDTTAPINLFNRVFLYVIGFIMVFWTYRYARDINVKITRTLVFIVNVLGILGLIAFIIQSQMIFWK